MKTNSMKLSKFAQKFNIRFFDTPDYNTQTTTSEGLSDAMKTYYSDYLIDLVEPHLVHDQFAQKKDIPQGSGKTIEFRIYDSLPKALKPLVEGVTPKGRSMRLSTLTAEIHQYGDYITISDILKLTAIDNEIVQATKMLGSQAGRTLDTVTREVMAGGTNVLYAPNVDSPDTIPLGRQFITANNKMTPDMSFQAKTVLSAKNAAKIDGSSYVAIIHPYAAYDLMRSKEWIELKQHDPDDYYHGEIGHIGDVRYVETTEAKIFYGANLASDARNLKVSSLSGNVVTFTGGTVEPDSLAGRYVIIESNVWKISENTATTITLDNSVEGFIAPTSAAVKQNDIIYPGEGGAEGCAVFAVTVVGENAYATTEIKGGGLQHIFKPLGSAGAADPLNQRGTVGWKATKAVERLVEEYMVRIECGSKYSDLITEAN